MQQKRNLGDYQVEGRRSFSNACANRTTATAEGPTKNVPANALGTFLISIVLFSVFLRHGTRTLGSIRGPQITLAKYP